MATQAESALLNATVYEQLATPGMEKKANDAINDFTRTKMREAGIARRVVPPLEITDNDLDRAVETDKPQKIIDKEMDSPAAISLSFGGLPDNWYILAPRYRVLFHRTMTPRFTKDVDTLRTWRMDIRQVLSDNALKDMQAEEDSVFLGGVNRALIGQDSTVTSTGVVQWKLINGGITRTTMQEAFRVLERTPSRLSPHTMLINNVTLRALQMWGRDEMGGDFSQELVKKGWAETEFMNVRLIVTIKRDLVPDDTIFLFADPKFIGKFFMLENTTMYIKREAFLLEFFAYETLAMAIGNVGGLARIDFAT